MNTQGLKPIFDEAEMKRTISEMRSLSPRVGVATSIFNGMLSAPKLLEVYRDDAREAVIANHREQMRISAVTNGKVQSATLSPEEAEAIKSTTFASMIRDAYMLADQIIAADKYIEPGSRLIVPMTLETSNDQVDLAATS